MDVQSIVPAQSTGDILAGICRMTVGGEEVVLPALSIRASTAWQASLDQQLTGLLAGLDDAGDDIGTLLAVLLSAPDKLLDLLRSYDQGHILPEDLESALTQAELLRNVLAAWGTENPIVAIGLGAAAPMAIPTSISPRPTSSRRRRTAGPRGTSKAS